MNRRTLLLSIAAVGTVMTAGCSSSSNQSKTEPEEAVKQYITAIQNGDTENVNEVLHPESPSYPRENITVPDQEITPNEVNQVSSREYIEQRAAGSNITKEEYQQAINSTEQSLRQLENETGAEKSAIVILSWEQEEGKREQEYPVIKDNDNWYVYV